MQMGAKSANKPDATAWKKKKIFHGFYLAARYVLCANALTEQIVKSVIRDRPSRWVSVAHQ